MSGEIVGRITTSNSTDLVVTDLKVREQMGLSKYGHYLHESPDDMLQHLYEELLDATLYVRTEIDRRNTERAK